MTEDDIVLTETVTRTYKRKTLRDERRTLRELKQMERPTNPELVEIGKTVHPYFLRDLDAIDARIDEITALLQEP